MIARIRAFLSKENEPLRRKVYGLLAPALALLVAKGLITEDVADLIAGGAGYLLLIPVTEWARANVMPFFRNPSPRHLDDGGRKVP